jgi:hypothetical protein
MGPDNNRLLCFTLCSSQIGFYFVTGSEIRWDAATTVGNDPEGRKLMLSGLRSFLGAAGILFVVSWLLKSWIYTVMNCWFSALSRVEQTEKADEETLATSQRKPRATRLAQLWTFLALIYIGLLRFARPQVPYNHMSGAIPFTFIQALGSRPTELHQTGDQAFPIPSLVGEEYWEGPRDHFKGWTPGKQTAKDAQPTWASGKLPEGFRRWGKESLHGDKEENAPQTGNHTSRKNIYSPTEDPLRITNLDLELLEPVAKALKNHKIPITHVVLVLMESARKDIFPFKAGSHLHGEILSSYKTQDPETIRKANTKLSKLTPISEKLTGEASGFSVHKNVSTDSGDQWWDATGPGMGGINFNGILTGSSLSFKSAVMNYCGAGPLPVNFMDEAKSENYQPCIMQVLELFNTLKEKTTSKSTYISSSGLEHIHGRNWSSVFMQSITGLYDEQDVLNKRMGFQEAIYREDIDQPSAKHYHKGMEEINYFG